MSVKKKTEVLVAGAGPVGLLSAILLRRQGIDVTIVDKSWRTATRAYALALHPSTLETLDEIGLAGAVIQEGRVLEQLAFYEGETRQAELVLPELKRGKSFMLSLPQSKLEVILEDALRELGVKVQWGYRLAGVDCGTADTPARACVEHLGSTSLGYTVSANVPIVLSDHYVQADFVLAADGHRSLVRQVLGIDYPEVADPQLFAVFELGVDPDVASETRVVLAEETMNVLWPLPENRCRWSFQLLDGSQFKSPRNKSRLLVEVGDEAFPMLPEEHLGKLIAERAPWFSHTYDDIRWSMVINFEQRLATSFGRGRVWVLGDAAHLCSPVVCRSMNVGMLEAKKASQAIADVLQSGEKMATFEEKREQCHSEWCELLRSDAHVDVERKDNRWAAAHGRELVACIPASGEDRARLASQLGLRTEPRDLGHGQHVVQ